MAKFSVNWKPQFTNPFSGLDKVVKSAKKMLSGDILGGAATALGLKDDEDKALEAQEKALAEQKDYQNKQLEIAQKNIDNVSEMNKANIASQERINQENINWARQLNNIEMARADSAHQREVADMRKSGLSPFASMNGADVGSFTTPTLNAPLNDIASVESSLNNMSSALGNQATLVAQNRQQSMDYALGMLSFAQGEAKLKHQKDYDNQMVELAKSQFDLQSKRDAINNAYTQIQTERARIESDNSISQEERAKELHAYDVKIRALEVSNQAITNDSLMISNNRSQLAYQSEQKEFEYKDRMLEVQYNQKCQDLAYTISQISGQNMRNGLMYIERENLRKQGVLTDTQIERILNEMGLDKKKYRLDVARTVISSIFGLTNTVTNVVNTVKP